ncbi:MAG: NUDIX hydrolase [Spirochaetes bacterium]|nr:MAG: NUDIX hydrolase [Spirochaetota bacterium]
MLRSVAGVAEQDGKFFVALRKSGTSIGERWEFPGGKPQPGESDKEALQREYHEELGVKINVGELLCSGQFENKGSNYKLNAYSITFLSERVFLKEHSRVMWVNIDELGALDMAYSDRIILKVLKEKKKEKH